MTQPDFGNVTQPRKSSGGRSPIIFIAIGGVLLLCLCFAISTLFSGGGDVVIDDGGVAPQQESGGDQGGTDLDGLLDEDFPTAESGNFQETNPDVGTGEGDSTLVLANNGDAEICYVFISPSGGDSWGEDRLPEGDEGIVLVGEEMSFKLDAGIYDVQARDCDDNVLDEIYEAPLPAGEEILWELQ